MLLGLLVLVLLSLGTFARTLGGEGKRWMFDDSPINGGSNAGDDHDWFIGDRNPGKRNAREFEKYNTDKRCLNLFTDSCSSGNGPGLIGDENAAGQIGKRDLEDPKLYNLLAYLYYNKKLEEDNARLHGDSVPEERRIYGLPN